MSWALFIFIFTAVISCDVITCENGGTCVDTRTGFACMCDPDYYGVTCEHSRNINYYTREQKKIVSARILVQVTIYCRLRIGRDGHLDKSEAAIYRNL